MSTVKANSYYDASGGSNAVLYGVASPPNSMGFRNRLLNADMRIDQRNAGASVSANGAYPVDRWQLGRSGGTIAASRSTTVPAGFTNSLLVSVTTGYSIAASDQNNIRQFVEGFNVSDLGWGAAGAQSVTLSFRVRSSLTGTFAGSLMNSAYDRSYVFTFTVSAANTWEEKTITIAGDTSGTWVTDNGVGIRLFFDFGSGSNSDGTAGAWSAGEKRRTSGAVQLFGTTGATFYITGVQLEAGSVASPFERRDYGRELMMCQRYYYKVVTAAAGAEPLAPNGFADSTTTAVCWTQFPVSMRTAPTALEQTGTAANYQVRYAGSSANCSSVPTFNIASVWGARSVFTVASGLTGGQAVALQTAATAGIYLAWSAEL